MYWVLAKQLSCYSRKHQNSSSTLASSMPPNNPNIGLNPVDYWILTIPWYRAATWWHLDKNPAQRRRRSRWLVAARMREGKMSSFWSRTCARIIISLIWLFTVNHSLPVITASFATANGPRNALCHSKFCQLLHNCRNKLYNKSRFQVNESEGYSQPTSVA